MENWRGYLAEQEPEVVSKKGISTVGDLKKAIRYIRATEAGGEVGKKAAEALVGMFPGGGTAMSIFSGVKDGAGLLKKLYGADDEAKTGTGLDKLNVDDVVSKIVDDPIEVKFLNYYANLINDMDDDAPLPDATTELQDFLAASFEDNTVKK